MLADKCETCIDAEDATDSINTLAAKYEDDNPATWSEEDQLRYQVWSSLVSLADAHRALAKHQHDMFSRQCTEVKPKQVIMCADYKAKVMLGQRREQRSSEFYTIPLRSLLGITLLIHPSDFEKVRDVLRENLQGYDPTSEIDPPVAVRVEEVEVQDQRGKTRHKRSEPQRPLQLNVKKVWKVHFEFLCDVVSQNGWQTIKCFEELFQHPLFRALRPDVVDLWMDNGSHFKNKELYGYFAGIRGFQMRWHHFAPCHGKSVCDTRFAILQHWFNDQILTSKVGMNSLIDVQNVIQQAQHTRNQSRIQEGKRPIVSFQIIVDVPDMPPTARILQFNGVRGQYSFIVKVERQKHYVYSASFTDLSDDGAVVEASFKKLDAKMELVQRKVTDLIRGLPDPEAPASLKKAQIAIASEELSQKQRCRLGDTRFTAESIQASISTTTATSTPNLL